MKIREIKELSLDDIQTNVNDTRKEIVEMRFQLAARKLESPAKLRSARRHLARLLTVQTQKANAANPNYQRLDIKRGRGMTSGGDEIAGADKTDMKRVRSTRAEEARVPKPTGALTRRTRENA
jgi:large subunit ribosomal protein L29